MLIANVIVKSVVMVVLLSTATYLPAVTLEYSTYLGGTSDDYGQDIAVDSAGKVSITGFSRSRCDFPLENVYQEFLAGEQDAFVAQFDTSGSVLIYSTYLGGSSEDMGYGIDLDSAGNVYLTGYTNSGDFPLRDPYQESMEGTRDAFITKLDISGSVLTYSTYLGGSGWDEGLGIDIDPGGNVYVTGFTFSDDFPIENVYQEFRNGENDAFVSKFDVSGSTLVYSTYLGGRRSDVGRDVAVDPHGHAYVTGTTTSSNFPIRNSYQPGYAGSGDTFVTKFAISGQSLSYSTYLGGGGLDEGMGIAVVTTGEAYLVGATLSDDFPVCDPYQGSHKKGKDVFISRLDQYGNSLLYSTYLGGSGTDVGYDISVNAGGRICVAGFTKSTDFPTFNPYQPGHGGHYDAFVSAFDFIGSGLTQLSYSTYLGGGGLDGAEGIAVGSGGSAYVTGYTSSSDFPSINPYQGYSGKADAFVSKLISDFEVEIELGITLEMPVDYFTLGEEFRLDATVVNWTEETLYDVPLVVFLDYGIEEYWFWPSWCHFPPHFDYEIIDVPLGETIIEIIPPFTWPDGMGSGYASFYGAILNPGMTEILGEIGYVEFSWGPGKGAGGEVNVTLQFEPREMFDPNGENRLPGEVLEEGDSLMPKIIFKTIGEERTPPPNDIRPGEWK